MSPYDTHVDTRPHGTSPLIAKDGEIKKGEFVWLVECFDLVAKRSRGLYWAGRSNRLTPRLDGAVDATYDVYAARRIPFDCQDIADQIAYGLNKMSTPDARCEWRAMSHGFA